MLCDHDTAPARNLPDSSSLASLRIRSGWTLQPASFAQHATLIREWINADPDHRGRVTAENWFSGEATCLLVEDREGPLFFLRLCNELRAGGIPPEPRRRWRIDMQFSPVSPLRIARALATGSAWLVERARHLGYDELVYDSSTPRLVQFMERNGFHRAEGEHVFKL